MTQATPKDYWISSTALYIELNAMGNPDYIQASCASGAQILVYVKDIIGYDAGHNYRRWPLQAAPTVFNSHTEKYVYAAIPRDMTLTASAWIVFPSELLDIYGKNEKAEQIGDERYYYINLQGIITSSGDNGAEQRDWKPSVSTGLLSSDEAISAIGSESEWYKYNSVDETVTFLKNLTMEEGTTFKTLFANFINVKPKGSLSFEGQGALTGIAQSLTTPDTNTDKIVTPDFVSTRAISKLRDDTAEGLIKFRKGLEIGSYQAGTQGGIIDSQGYAELLSVIVRGLISSANYKSGFDGEGYRLWNDENGLSNLEIDKLTVRQIMTVFELIIDRIRAVGGQIVVSAANGKIKTVEDTGEAYKITFEGENYFQAHDLMRCQVFKDNEIRGYWVEVAASYSDYVVVAKSEFSGTITIGDKKLIITEPKEGDEVVLMGNTTNSKRQNLISISATEDGEPRIDVLDRVKAKNFNGALRARLGNLDGITDTRFPLDAQPHGNGLYADNVYLRGSFLLSTGEDVRTKFDVVEGKISSSVDAVRKELMEDKGYFNNPTFGDGMSHWTAENETTFFFLGNKWIWANNNVLTKKGDGASLATDDGRTVVRIKNKYICQKFADLRAVPEIKTNKDGKKEPVPVYLSFYYKVKKKGTLTIGFENINNDGFIDYEPLSYSQELDVTETYQQLTVSGLWNATGDFKLSFTGEMLVYMFVLSADRIESLTYTYRTLFEQSEKLVKIAAENFDKDGNVLEGSQIITTAKYNELISQRFDEKGGLKNTAGLVTTTDWDTWHATYTKDMAKKMDIESFAGMFATAVDENSNIVKKADISAFVSKDENGNLESGVHVGADNIVLEGVVTANGNFKILKDGSMEAVNGKFKGEVTADSGTIGGFEVSKGRIGVAAEKNGSSDNPYATSNKNTGLFLYPDEIGFNGTDRQVMVGNIDLYGSRLMGRFIDDSKQVLSVDGLVIAVRGSYEENMAIRFGGGCIGGMAYKNQVVGFGEYETEKKPDKLTVDIDRYTNCIYAATEMRWRAKSTDEWQTVGRDIYVNLPEMQHYDDGHTIKIKRGPGSGNVYIVPGKTNWVNLEYEGSNINHVKVSGKAFIVSGRGTYDTEKMEIASEYDAMELVYFRDLVATVNGTTYRGGWVQWKNPRDW